MNEKPASPKSNTAPEDKHVSAMRIAKAIARAGICSRREAERFIASGRVSVNGRKIDSPALNVTDQDKIIVDGKPLPRAEPIKLWRFHKPKGLVTTAKDERDRKTIFDALPKDMPRTITIGRLDINTEGLLLLTNDGELARHIELPTTGWLRRYKVRAKGIITQYQLDALKDGITIDGVKYGPIDAVLEKQQGANCWFTMGLREGKNREIKRIAEHLGLSVNRLIRLSFGPFMLGDLKEGEVEEIKSHILADQLGPKLAAKFSLKPSIGQAKAKSKHLKSSPPRSNRSTKARPGDKGRPGDKARAGVKGRPGERARPGDKRRTATPKKGSPRRPTKR